MSEPQLVVVAEDDEGYSFPIQRALGREGFEVTVVTTKDDLVRVGLEAAVLLVDVRLPSSAYEGLEAVDQLIEAGLEQRVPLIFISVLMETSQGVVSKLGQLKHLAKGRYRWLEKPFEPRMLAKLVRRSLAET